MCAPDSRLSPTASASSWSAASATWPGRLEQAGVDDLEAGVAQRPGDHLGAAVVPVQPGLGNDDAVASQHSPPPVAGADRPDGAVTLAMGPAPRPKDAVVAVRPEAQG